MCGEADHAIQKRLLSEQNLTFKKAFEISQSHESAAKDIVTLQGPSPQVHQLADSVGSSCYINVEGKVINKVNVNLELQPVITVAKLVTSNLFVVL